MSTFSERLRQLGFYNYADYLKSDHWFKVKLRLRECRCLVCNSPLFELHHVTYERLGCELDSDLRPLCAEHHDAVHTLIGYRINLTDQAIAQLRREMGVFAKYTPPQRRKQPRSKKRRKKAPRDPFFGMASARGRGR